MIHWARPPLSEKYPIQETPQYSCEIQFLVINISIIPDTHYNNPQYMMKLFLLLY